MTRIFLGIVCIFFQSSLQAACSPQLGPSAEETPRTPDAPTPGNHIKQSPKTAKGQTTTSCQQTKVDLPAGSRFRDVRASSPGLPFPRIVPSSGQLLIPPLCVVVKTIQYSPNMPPNIVYILRTDNYPLLYSSEK